MRLLIVSILCLVLFFPTYWVLSSVFGDTLGAALAVLLSWVLLPYFLLRSWTYSNSPILQVGNYLLAICVLGFSGWIIYRGFTEGFDADSNYRLLYSYVFCAIYFLAQGHLPYQKATHDQQSESGT